MENENDSKKYFDPNQYSTIVVGTGEELSERVSDNKITREKIDSLISLLTDSKNREVKEETLLALKRENKGEILLAAIASPHSAPVRSILVAACWESEINFSTYLPFFITLALDADYLVSLEAITVIQNMEGKFNEAAVKEGIKKVKAEQKNISSERLVLLNDLVNTLENFLGSSGQ